ncbi:MAG: heparinase II/III family protein, partial [Lentisphaeria bacterium]|nr:heparinase II/III family protein [Lentisphaeria bacterium]
MNTPIDFELEQRPSPSLFLSTDDLDFIRSEGKKPGTYQRGSYLKTREAVDAWLVKPLAMPREGAKGSLLYNCSEDAAYLIVDPDKPHEHVCPKCGKVYSGGLYDSWWRYMIFERRAYAARDLALIYALDADETCGKAAAKILLEFADLNPTIPVINRARLGREALDEVRMLIALAAAYDFIRDGGFLDPEQKEHIETDYFRDIAELISIGPGDWSVDQTVGCNFQATIITGVGLSGLLINDDALVEYAINGPAGFNALMEKGVLPNGMWWESSQQYHFAVMRWLLFLSEAAWNSGINLYENKKFQDMFTLGQKMMYPDGQIPCFNDGIYDRHPINVFTSCSEIYFNRTKDERVTGLFTANKITADPSPNWAWDLNLAVNPDWPDGTAPPLSSINLSPSMAILRTDGADPISVYMDFGPHGGSHGHVDNLGIIIHANNRIQAPDFGNGGTYSLPQHQGWYKQSISHNTIIPDEKSLMPG